MDSTSNDNISFSPEKSETQKCIEPVDFAITNDITSQSDMQNHPRITNFDTFEALQLALENATTIEEQIKFSYELPIIFDQVTQRYKFPHYAKESYLDQINYLNGKQHSPLTHSDFTTFDFTKSQLYKRRSRELPNVEPIVLPPLTTRPVLAPLTITTPTSQDNMFVPPPHNPDKYTVSPLELWYNEQQQISK
jgi:hypothetical protein